jgi:hypothetical protein
MNFNNRKQIYNTTTNRTMKDLNLRNSIACQRELSLCAPKNYLLLCFCVRISRPFANRPSTPTCHRKTARGQVELTRISNPFLPIKLPKLTVFCADKRSTICARLGLLNDSQLFKRGWFQKTKLHYYFAQIRHINT